MGERQAKIRFLEAKRDLAQMQLNAELARDAATSKRRTIADLLLEEAAGNEGRRDIPACAHAPGVRVKSPVADHFGRLESSLRGLPSKVRHLEYEDLALLHRRLVDSAAEAWTLLQLMLARLERSGQ